MEADKIQIKPITLAKTAFRAESTKTAAVSPAKNTTDLKNMPVSAIDIKTPIPYATTGDIPLFNDLKAKTYRLANGQKVIVLPKKGPTVVKTYVNVGSMNEPDNLRGISHFIEHNLFNGTQNLKAGDFFRKVNELGASTNASTSFSTTDYYISSQLLKEGDLEEKIKMHADMLQNPTFAPDMLEKERGPVISEISMVMDDPQNNIYPLPLAVTGKYNCQVGRIRKDCAFDNGLCFWVAGDQLLKGAALNAVQIAEELAKNW